MEYPSINEINSNLKKFMSPALYKKQYPEFYKYIKATYPFAKKITEGLWCFYHNLTEQPKCPVCGNPVKFRCWTDGYNEFCSSNCMRRGTRDRAAKTMMDKYGGVGMASKITRQKIVKTMIDEYGGVGMASEQIRNKIRETKTDRYGTPGYNNQEKITSTLIERYGVEHALQSDELLNKAKQTCMAHHGVEYAGQVESGKIKSKQTRKQRYGDENYVNLNKMAKTNLKKYGRAWGFDYDKIKQTCRERYGDENPLTARCARGEIKYHGYSKVSQKCFQEFDKYLTQFTTLYAEHGGEHMIQCGRKNYYVDYFIKELNVAIEFNGDKYHGNPELYGPNDHCFPHNDSITALDLWQKDIEKYSAIEETGVKVYVIWESEYLHLTDVKAWLENKLNIQL